MFNENSNFIYYLIALTLGFAAVKTYYHFKFKREPQVTEFDKSLWNFKLVSIFFVVVIFFLIQYLPFTGYLISIHPQESQETVLQKLIENQQELSKNVDSLRHILDFVMFLAVMYIFGVINFIGTLQKMRQKDLIENDPTLKKPLGL